MRPIEYSTHDEEDKDSLVIEHMTSSTWIWVGAAIGVVVLVVIAMGYYRKKIRKMSNKQLSSVANFDVENSDYTAKGASGIAEGSGRFMYGSQPFYTPRGEHIGAGGKQYYADQLAEMDKLSIPRYRLGQGGPDKPLLEIQNYNAHGQFPTDMRRFFRSI